MKLLAFSDVHCDMGAVESLVERSREADAVAAVGDFARVHEGLEETIRGLSSIDVPALVVPGNNETDEALRAACEAWESAIVLHGESVEVDGVVFFGIGAGIPTTPWDWSFDLTDREADKLLEGMPEGAVLLSHSPPKGHVDQGYGSEAVLDAVQEKKARAVLCGHIHEEWGQESRIGDAVVRNLGPDGFLVEL